MMRRNTTFLIFECAACLWTCGWEWNSSGLHAWKCERTSEKFRLYDWLIHSSTNGSRTLWWMQLWSLLPLALQDRGVTSTVGGYYRLMIFAVRYGRGIFRYFSWGCPSFDFLTQTQRRIRFWKYPSSAWVTAPTEEYTPGKVHGLDVCRNKLFVLTHFFELDTWPQLNKFLTKLFNNIHHAHCSGMARIGFLLISMILWWKCFCS